MPAEVDGPSSDELPLLFFFDCESTGGSMYNDHIIELGAKVVEVVAVPNSVSITQHQYGSLIHTSQSIAKAVQSKCGIAAQMLVTEPPFRHVLKSFLHGSLQLYKKWSSGKSSNIFQYLLPTMDLFLIFI